MDGNATPLHRDDSANTLADRLNRLKQRMNSGGDDLPESWVAEPGDELIGEFLHWSEGTTRLGETHKIAVIADAKTGELRAVWTFYVALREELAKAAPKAGDLIGIRRLDDGLSDKSKQTYRRYRVEVEQ